MSIPINKHYEQMCNGAALKQMGVSVLDKIDANFSDQIEDWYNGRKLNIQLKANNISDTIQRVLAQY